ncbi:unnamed protein product [Rotaria sordida]|uniref:P2X purinoceptor n=1 Tax=Rotaria sordida TaxID=392033 RepID=A0A813Y509_9BILA|nr:unnamed protein product [Rotaria sordida]CAF0877720.1 unnamed protein product [Rotaria sordida]
MVSNVFYKTRYHIGKSVKEFLTGYFTEYETSKLVVINNPKYATLLRIIQILILLYSVIYLLIYEKGYQKQDTAPIFAVTLKVKGIGYVQTTENKTIIIDVADYIIPASENNAIFIMTSFIQTDQTRSICAESKKVRGAKCKDDSDCFNKTFTPYMNGRWTGRCLLPPDTNVANETTNLTKTPTGLCEYAGWCPPEDDEIPTLLVQGVFGFTIFMKNFIEFPEFDVKHKNMVDNLKPCIFHPKTNKDCPIFSIDYIMNEAEKNITERDLMLRHGGVIRMKADWDCNLDRDLKLCKPEYSFARLDVPFHEKPFSAGFNFRFSNFWKYNQTDFRVLTKAFGLRFIVSISGKAGKFDFITFTLNIGSLVGIFGLATFICDIVILHLSKKANAYRNHVFETVHLKTRLNTAFNDVRAHFQDKNELDPSSLSNNKTELSNDKTKLSSDKKELSNGIIHTITQPSPRKTIAIRPLILMQPDL